LENLPAIIADPHPARKMGLAVLAWVFAHAGEKRVRSRISPPGVEFLL
jgi:hypothetical protein